MNYEVDLFRINDREFLWYLRINIASAHSHKSSTLLDYTYDLMDKVAARW